VNKPYIVASKESKYALIERKSEFVGRVFPIESESIALEILAKIKKENYNASHNCYAYVIGVNSEIQRSSDDGEPSGTAGLPILDVLRKGGITNTLIIVTRFFGGTLLGSGGLIRAYSECASQTIKSSALSRVLTSKVYLIETDYSSFERIRYDLNNNGFIITNVEYLSKVFIKTTCADNLHDSPEKLVSESTSGTAIITEIGDMETRSLL